MPLECQKPVRQQRGAVQCTGWCSFLSINPTVLLRREKVIDMEPEAVFIYLGHVMSMCNIEGTHHLIHQKLSNVIVCIANTYTGPSLKCGSVALCHTTLTQRHTTFSRICDYVIMGVHCAHALCMQLYTSSTCNGMMSSSSSSATASESDS